MKVTAFIFARGGSKGLPGKNIRNLGGKPLLAWAIEQARAVDRINRIIVSTDAPEIVEVALQYGAEVPFMRPAELAKDDSPEWLAWRHALDYLKNTEGQMPDVMLSIPATAPLRLPIDIEACLDEYLAYQPDVVVTVSDAQRSPYFNMVKQDSDGKVELVIPQDMRIKRRQDAPVVFDMATVAYAVKPEFVMSRSGIFDGLVRAVHIPRERAIDIDTLLDFKIAECLLGIQRQADE